MILGLEPITLIISMEEMKDDMKLIQSLKD